MVTLQNHSEGLLEVQKASAMPCTLASSSNLLTNDAMSAATSVRFARQSSGRLSDEWKPQCGKHIFTLSHFCSFSRSIAEPSPHSSSYNGPLPSHSHSQVVLLLAWWHHRSSGLCLPPSFQFISRSAKSCNITNRLDISIELARNDAAFVQLPSRPLQWSGHIDNHKKW